jgi:hypothetical protein
MANEKRKRQIAIGGLVEDNPLTNSATTLTSAGLAAITGGIGSTEHMAIVLDPDGLEGAPEIAYLTAVTNGAISGTVARGQEGTTAREHLRDTPWVHATTLRDIERISRTKIRATGDKTTTSNGTFVDIDATNLPSLTVYAEIGDIIEVELVANMSQTSGYAIEFDWVVDRPTSADTTVRGSSGSVARYTQLGGGTSDWVQFRIFGTFTVTERGTHGFKPQWMVNGNTGRLKNASGGGLDDVPIIHTVRNTGPEAA